MFQLSFLILLCASCLILKTLSLCHYRAGANLRQIIDKSEYKGTRLVGALQEFESARSRVLDGLLDRLDCRFADVKMDVLHATHITNLDEWPTKDVPLGSHFFKTREIYL